MNTESIIGHIVVVGLLVVVMFLGGWVIGESSGFVKGRRREREEREKQQQQNYWEQFFKHFQGGQNGR